MPGTPAQGITCTFPSEKELQSLEPLDSGSDGQTFWEGAGDLWGILVLLGEHRVAHHVLHSEKSIPLHFIILLHPALILYSHGLTPGKLNYLGPFIYPPKQTLNWKSPTDKNPRIFRGNLEPILHHPLGTSIHMRLLGQNWMPSTSQYPWLLWSKREAL